MTTPASAARRRYGRLVLALVLVAGAPAPLRAQQPFLDLHWSPVLPGDLKLDAPGGPPAAPGGRPHRIRLFRIQPGFLSDPVGLDEGPLPDAPTTPDPDPGPVQFAVGADNPHFDFRQRGDPGGLGFFRVNSQVQLLDSPTTGFTFGVQAVTPAGLEYAGLPERQGPTVLTPALGLFHALGDGTAVQGYVGKNVLVNGGGPQPVQQALQYGMAVQRPLTTAGPEALRQFYLSVGALGQYRLEKDASRPPVVWEVLPGFHWKLADHWWVSGGVIVPVGPVKTDTGLWQVTCSLQF